MTVYHLPERATQRREIVEFRAQVEAGTREWIARIWHDDVEAKQAARQGRDEKERARRKGADAMNGMHLTFEEYRRQSVALAAALLPESPRAELSAMATFEVLGDNWAQDLLERARQGQAFDAATIADIEEKAPRLAALLRREIEGWN